MRTSAALILLALLSVSAAAAPVPPADSFKVFDRPSDDGSALLVTWACPPEDNAVATYALEAARSADDFAAGKFETMPVKLSKRSRTSAKPEYFGHSKANKGFCFVQFYPTEVFPVPGPSEMPPERLRAFAAAGTIDNASLTRALAVLENSSKLDNELLPAQTADRQWFQQFSERLNEDNALRTAVREKLIDRETLDRGLATLAWSEKLDNQLVPAQTRERRWFRHLSDYLDKKAANRHEAQVRRAEAETYYFRLAVMDKGTKRYVERDGKPVVVSAAAVPNFFNFSKLNTLVLSLVFCVVVVAFIYVAKRRAGLFIRRIAGLDAIDEAIGRATETNRPVFFIHGLGGVADMATIASINILSQAARRTAEHDSRIRVMNNDALVTAVSLEVVRQAYSTAGRPDAFNPDDVSLVASEQFAYVAAVGGAMVREKPGANFLMGSFYAESLLLAETGASTGAIQVAGTDSYTQIPFFITTCDYTLIGEELYAAGAYLSREPRQLGSLRGQDVGKAFLMVIIVVVSLAATAAVLFHGDASWLRDIFKAVQ